MRKLKRNIKCFIGYLEKMYYKLLLVKKTKLFNKTDKKLILLNTPVHGNIGDQAITIAELRFFQEYFPKILLIEINEKLWKYEYTRIIEKIDKDDVILIHGGGYLGTIWREVAEKAMDMISSFPDNIKIILPQTAYYSRLEEDILMKDSLFYSQQKKLFICARDKATYEILTKKQKIEKSKVLFTPDIVTTMRYAKQNSHRDGVLFILRSDKEKINRDGVVRNVISELKKEGIKVTISDTTVKFFLSCFRNVYVNYKLSQFSRYKLVVTDRLHGMYFAAISSTPCIAMNNISKKVEGGYFWLQDLEYVVISTSGELDYDGVISVKEIDVKKYNNAPMIKQFKDLIILIKNSLED